jgi:hypothetical protein
MSTRHSYYDPAKFAEGSNVRVAERDALDRFHQTWKYHHRLEPEQLNYAGRIAKVKRSAMYHGGDIIYQLENVPGIWHEQCLSPVSSERE